MKIYPPNTLHHIVCVCYSLTNQQVDFFHDSQFSGLRALLDTEMKRLQARGVGSKRKQDETLTEEEENIRDSLPVQLAYKL